MPEIAIIEAFEDLPDPRRGAGQRHAQALCLALFTLAVAAGNRGFLAIGDWLKSYEDELIRLFTPPKKSVAILQYDSSDPAKDGLSAIL